jgi:hypothetical protein
MAFAFSLLTDNGSPHWTLFATFCFCPGQRVNHCCRLIRRGQAGGHVLPVARVQLVADDLFRADPPVDDSSRAAARKLDARALRPGARRAHQQRDKQSGDNLLASPIVRSGRFSTQISIDSVRATSRGRPAVRGATLRLRRLFRVVRTGRTLAAPALESPQEGRQEVLEKFSR